jgi:outer membrane protein assembly factor BamA
LRRSSGCPTVRAAASASLVSARRRDRRPARCASRAAGGPVSVCTGAGRRRRASAAAGLLLAAWAVLAPRPAAAQTFERDSVEVTSIEFAGATAFPHETLRTAIMTNATRCSNPALALFCLSGIGLQRNFLDDRTLAADVARLRVFYFSRGYREATVALDTVRDERGVRIRFIIDERTPVRVASLGFDETGDLPLDLFRNLPLRVLEPFSLPGYEATRDSLTARLHSHGFAHAQVLPSYMIPRDAPYAAQVVFDIETGSRARFGELEIVGTERISPKVVRKMLDFAPGDVYDQSALLRSQRNLFGLEVFRHAEVVAVPPAEWDTIVPVRVQVNEGDIHRVRFGAGMSTAEFISAEGRWASRNFVGGARRLEVRGRVSHLFAGELEPFPFFETGRGIYGQISGSLTADFAQPWFFDRLNTLRAGLFAERRNLPDVYVRTAHGGYVSFNRVLGASSSGTLGYRPERTKLETEDGDLIFCVSLLACADADIDVLRAPHWLSPLAISLARDRSNSFFAPTRGTVLRLDAELAGRATGSEFGYVRIIGEATEYRAVARGVVLATRVRPGWAYSRDDGDGLGLHPQKRFFGGGANSVRGFGQYRMGPKLLTISAAEHLARPLDEGGAGCSAQAINAGACDAALLADAAPDLFQVRPVGGAVMLEGNVELRVPLWGEQLRGAAFVDFGQVWSEPRVISAGSVVWTPGAGVRYHSPIGPIRIDVGYNPQGAERLNLVSTEVWSCAGSVCEEIEPDRTYEWDELSNRQRLRPQQAVSWSPYRSLLSRFQLHFSIGQAF